MTHELQLPSLTCIQEIHLHLVDIRRREVQPLTSPEQKRVLADSIGFGRRTDDREHGFQVLGEEGVEECAVLGCQGHEGEMEMMVSARAPWKKEEGMHDEVRQGQSSEAAR